ncbi:MAG: hypothetical protein Q9208_004539 [Pyrenodesmia sp. 3 TL-2023]
MEGPCPRFALILFFLCLSSIPQSSSLALRADPPNPASKPSLEDVFAIDRVVGNLVHAQAYSPDIRYREATMLFVLLAVDNVDNIDGHHTLSDNIGDFRDIKCLFRYGARRPRRPEESDFSVRNRWPDHWEQWSPPQPDPEPERLLLPFQWQQASRRMSVARADALLKASGQRSRYALPFDPTHRYTTSWVLPPLVLAIIRIILSIYAFTTTFFILAWEGVHGRHLENRLYHSYFTHLTYWGLAFYFLFSSLHTLRYALTGASWLQKWPVALQIAHAVFYTTIVTFPILVTAVFWAVIYSGVWFPDDFGAWINTSQHTLNTVFAAFEIFFTRTSPPPLAHLPILVVILALYLALAYLTHATQGFYPYPFLDPNNGSGRLAAYILGILAAACVIYAIVWLIIWIRRWMTEAKLGMHGKFTKNRDISDEEMVGVRTDHIK